jgi:hypothetical protein
MLNMKKILLFFLLQLITILFFVRCEDENNSFKTAEGYIIGSFRGNEKDGEDGIFTGEVTERGFIIVLKDNTDSMYTFSIPEDILDFPSEILTPGCDVNNCGPEYFPNKEEYKIKFKYRNSKNSEIIYFACGCYDYFIPYNWNLINQVIVENVEEI